MEPITSAVRRPHWISRNVRQRVVVVEDVSWSMEGDKARDATAAIRDLLAELADLKNKNGFQVALVHFAGTARVACPFQDAGALAASLPAVVHDSWTNLHAALEQALGLLSTPAAGEGISWLRPVVLMFTDGEHNHGPDPRGVAAQVRSEGDLVTVAYGGTAGERLLKDIATSPQHFYRCSNGAELRGFLAAVGATLVHTLARGQAATGALAAVEAQLPAAGQ